MTLPAVIRDVDHMLGVDRNEALNPFNPFLTIYAATARRTEAGEVIGADEAVSREEALRMMTSAAARFSFDEKDRGSIEHGKLADFVVLDTDIMTCPADQLPTIPTGPHGGRGACRVRAHGHAVTRRRRPCGRSPAVVAQPFRAAWGRRP
jgi:cytosine/adenosine deaminase-related metal-dependent hydrolase